MDQPGLKLSVVSRMPAFNGRTLRPYQIGKDQCIGILYDEPFALHIENDDVRREIIVSIDGVNLLTAKKAVLEDRNNRFVIGPYRFFELTSWAESNEGGAHLIFVDPKNGVARHTIDDESQRGIISIACFKEAVSPERPVTRGAPIPKGGPSSSSPFGGAAVGAGTYTEQRLRTVDGLTNPVFEGVVHLRYMPHLELVAKLRAKSVTPPSNEPLPGFFPPPRMADLGTTPRVDQPARMNEEYPRFL